MINIESYIILIRDKDFNKMGYVDIKDDGSVGLVDDFSKAYVFTSMKDVTEKKPKYMKVYPNCYYEIHNLKRENKAKT